jgi:hypothetical protein
LVEAETIEFSPANSLGFPENPVVKRERFGARAIQKFQYIPYEMGSERFGATKSFPTTSEGILSIVP